MHPSVSIIKQSIDSANSCDMCIDRIEMSVLMAEEIAQSMQVSITYPFQMSFMIPSSLKLFGHDVYVTDTHNDDYLSISYKRRLIGEQTEG